MIERWRPIPGWEGFYEASDLGRVRSVDRTVVVPNPHGVPSPRQYRGRELRAGLFKNGYLQVSLTAPDRSRRYAYVHDLVIEAFVGPKPPETEVCHNNGRRGDNRLLNLRYDSRSANAMDRHKHGTMNPAVGEACPSAKLTEADVLWARRAEGAFSYREMGRMLGVSHHTVISACRSETWRHI